MDLKAFVAETLKQLIDGVVEAQAYARTKEASINPKFQEPVGSTTYSRATKVDFDIVVTVESTSGSTGGGGLFVGPAAIGARDNNEDRSAHETRIRLPVHVLLPVDTEASDRLQAGRILPG